MNAPHPGCTCSKCFEKKTKRYLFPNGIIRDRLYDKHAKVFNHLCWILPRYFDRGFTFFHYIQWHKRLRFDNKQHIEISSSGREMKREELLLDLYKYYDKKDKPPISSANIFKYS